MHKILKASTLAVVGMVVLSASSVKASPLGDAISNKSASVSLSGNETISRTFYHAMEIDGNGYGINGALNFRDYKSGSSFTTRSGLNAHDVGSSTVDVDNNYAVNLRKSWTNNNGRSTLVSRGDLVLTGNTFANNTAGASINGKNGGAVQVLGAIDTNLDSAAHRETKAKINANTFYKNAGYQGGAVDFDSTTALAAEFNNNYFIENNAVDHGGAVDMHTHIDQMDGNHFVRNTSVLGGAIYSHRVTQVTGNGNKFIGNTATQDGGGVYMEQSNGGRFSLTNGTYTSNTAGRNGGAIYNGGNMVIGSSTFTGNSANRGGAIYNAVTGRVALTGGNTFQNNKANSAGADIYNLGTVNFTNDNTFAENSASNAIYNEGVFNIANGTTSFLGGVNTLERKKVGSINVNNRGIMDIGSSAIYANSVNFGNGSTLVSHIKDATQTDNRGSGTYGHIIANEVGVNTVKSDLQIVIRNGEIAEGETRRVHIIRAGDMDGEFTDLANNRLYDIKAEGNGWYVITHKQEEPVDPCLGENPPAYCSDPCLGENPPAYCTDPCLGDNPPEYCQTTPPGPEDTRTQKVCTSIDCVDDVWIDEGLYDVLEGTKAEEVLDEFNRLTQYDPDKILDANYGIAPDLSPIIQAHAAEINRNLNNIIHNRLYGSMERTGYRFRSKRYYRFPRHESHLWVQGIAGKSEWDAERGFDGTTKGLAVGFDGKVSDATRLGIAYAYTLGDFDSIGRETEIDSHTGMFYGEYNPNRFYANWMATYTRSAYEENKRVGRVNVRADFDVDAIGAQVMVGRKVGPIVNGNWSTGVFMPEVGLRYLYTKQHDYTDEALQQVEGQSGNTLTGLAGIQYTIGYKLSPNVSWYPELRAALTYDFVQADNKTRVNLANGNIYELEGEKLDKFGIELGARAGIDINRKSELSIEYDGVIQGDYSNHTGMANAKYKF